MVLVASYLHIVDFVPLAYLVADNLEHCLYIFTKYFSSILCWTYQVVEQKIDIMTLVDMVGHSVIIPILGDSAAELRSIL